MAETIPSGRPLVPLPGAAVFQELAHIDPHRRLNLLPRWTARFDWLKPNKGNPAELLMVLREPGFVRLLPWTPCGEQVRIRYEELAADEGSDDNLEAMRLLQDSYGRLQVDTEHRPYLGDAALAHLGISLERGVRSPVYVVVYPNSLGLLSVEAREFRLKHAALLDGLPA
ncbi:MULTISPECIES: hypothetical protein [unclassified Bradyrhizobium]|uniref:hypothetical protein n=1 Tax=unclassified Bradyrhizobium TaxID=2631580 RepID=UPI0028E23877|nr:MULTISPECIES: hypothetical protein [unclassified Bradyrhizobium]